MEQLVRAAISKLCVGDAADAICCLLPGMTLDEIIEKFKWLFESVESFDTLMQECYQIVQGLMPGMSFKSNQITAFSCYD